MTSLGSPAWLADETSRLLEFGKASALPTGGAAYLDSHGQPDPQYGVQTWITARMLHTYSLATLLGVPGAREVAEAALAGLKGMLHDDSRGGWFHAVAPSAPPRQLASRLAGGLERECGEAVYRDHGASVTMVPDLASGKSAYDHAFVMLAASSAVQAGIPGARELLDEAKATYLGKFWDDAVGRPVDTWNADFTQVETYRGLNSTMHSVEAMLSVAAAVDDAEAAVWLDRAARAAALVTELADAHDGRLPEHFTAANVGDDWQVDLELNADRPGDQFKPYGATPGHGLEWARLLLHLEAAQQAAQNSVGRVRATATSRSAGSGACIETSDAQNSVGSEDSVGRVLGSAECIETTESPDTDLLSTAVKLFDRAITDGWAADGADGFVYTTDWDGNPVVRTRMHWVVCEAIAVAAVLYARTGEPRYADLYAKWWDYAEKHFIDREHGSWRHELDEANAPTETVWPGKPDIYHAVQATLIPRLPLTPMLAGALADGNLSA